MKINRRLYILKVSFPEEFADSQRNVMIWGFPGTGSIPESGRPPGEGNGPGFLPGKSHEQRSLADFGHWGPKSQT